MLRLLEKLWKDHQHVRICEVLTLVLMQSSHVLFFLLVDICKFFGCELGAQTQMDSKNSRYIVNGSHEGPKLQDLLDVFIKKFVLCPECENPETTLVKSYV